MQQFAYANTTLGPLRGAITDGICVFKDIPYAASTAGAARFMAPRKREPWSAPRDALQFGPLCPQLAVSIADIDYELLDLLRGGFELPACPPSEDCLVLNVWTPALPSTNPAAHRPVMVWCHGGGFTSGSGGGDWCDGTALAQRGDVVVVTFNHRINILGYLHLGDIGGETYAASGNAGTLDIIAALEWVRDNIAEFGGDANNVTLFGNSGGGCKISLLMTMPSAQGLFHKAIVQSGAIRRMAATRAAKTEIAHALLQHLAIPEQQVDQLQQVSVEQLHEAMAAVQTTLGHSSTMGVAAPTVDGRFLPEHPFDPIAPAVSANIPLLIGTTREEMTLFLGSSAFNIDADELSTRVQQLAQIDANAAQSLIDIYRNADPTATPSALLFKLATDYMLRIDAIVQAERKSIQAAPVFMYQFTWPTPAYDGKYGATHGSEVPFVFANIDKAPGLIAQPANEHRALQEKISDAWLNFARHGNPSHSRLPLWPPYTTALRNTMLLGEHCEVVSDPDRAARVALQAIKF